MRSGKLWVALFLVAAAPPSPPPSAGTVAIVVRAAGGPAAAAFADAASQAFTARGFTILDDPDHAAYVADLTVAQAALGTGLGKDPHPAKVSAIGTGVSIPFSTGASSEFTIQRTTLEISLHKRGESGTVWAGTAVTVRAAGNSAAVARALSGALLSGYPAQPKEAVGVP